MKLKTNTTATAFLCLALTAGQAWAGSCLTLNPGMLATFLPKEPIYAVLTSIPCSPDIVSHQSPLQNGTGVLYSSLLGDKKLNLAFDDFGLLVYASLGDFSGSGDIFNRGYFYAAFEVELPPKNIPSWDFRQGRGADMHSVPALSPNQ